MTREIMVGANNEVLVAEQEDWENIKMMSRRAGHGDGGTTRWRIQDRDSGWILGQWDRVVMKDARYTQGLTYSTEHDGWNTTDAL